MLVIVFLLDYCKKRKCFWISDWVMLVPLNAREGWFNFRSLWEKITSFACLLIWGLKFIFHWKAQLLIFSKSSFKLIPDWFISYTTEKSEVSPANNLGFELKGYLRHKTIFCHKVVLDMQLMNFFIWRKNHVLFSRYRDFCVFVKSADFKIRDLIMNIASSWSYAYVYFFWILSTIKMRLGQILVCYTTNISNIFLAESWRLENSSRLFSDFINMTI